MLVTAAFAALPPGSAGAVTQMASVNSVAIQADDDAFNPTISDDGRFVAFHSYAGNLHPDDPDYDSDVFVRDLRTGTTLLASRASGASGPNGNGGSFRPAISGNGRYVAYFSFSTNLHPDDANTSPSIFVRDLLAGTTTLVSRATGVAGANGNGFSYNATISADGRYVAFHSTATNLDSGDSDPGLDIFVRDLVANTTVLASRASGSIGARGNGLSRDPDISGDGRYVVFESASTNLHGDDTDAMSDIFVRDLVAHTTALVSRASGALGAKGNGPSLGADISSTGGVVAFESYSTNFDPDDADGYPDIYVRSIPGGTPVTTLVSRADGAAGAKANAITEEASISAGGRFVGFQSGATNLSPDDPDTVTDIFVRDLVARTTVLVSRPSPPTPGKGDANSYAPSLSRDGTTAFYSLADNLVAGDGNAALDVFVVDDLDRDRIPNRIENRAPPPDRGGAGMPRSP